MSDEIVVLEAVIALRAADDGFDDLVASVTEVVDEAVSESAADLHIEQWEPVPQRGSVQRVFLTSVGLLGLTRSSLSGFSKVLNEVATVFGDTAGAGVLTVEIGDSVYPLSEVTEEMIESWLPQPAP